MHKGISYESWGALNRQRAQELAINGYDLPFDFRLMFLAMANSDRIGHALFATDQIRTLLHVVNKRTGELHPLSPKGFGDALNRAIGRSLLAGQKHRRCLQLPADLWEMKAHGSSSCGYCGVGPIAKKWERLAS